MSETTYPPGWDQERVLKVLAHYEEQTDEEAVAEDEASFETPGPTTMEVPVIRELIVKHRKHTQRGSGS